MSGSPDASRDFREYRRLPRSPEVQGLPETSPGIGLISSGYALLIAEGVADPDVLVAIDCQIVLYIIKTVFSCVAMFTKDHRVLCDHEGVTLPLGMVSKKHARGKARRPHPAG